MEWTVFCGGVGAARFLSGLMQVVPPEDITAIINTGDDLTLYGLHISPDIDIVTYTLAGMVDPQKGWGIGGDTFSCLSMLNRLGHDTWFNLGDRDLGTHIHRTFMLKQGHPLSRITAEIGRALGVECRLLPMSDQAIRTFIDTGTQVLPFQTYFVERKAEDPVKKVLYKGMESAVPAPGAVEAIQRAAGIIIAPSNPLVSIGTILSVPGIREALGKSETPVAAISPIVGGKTLKGPADKMMQALGYEASALGIARFYEDILDVLIIDSRDRSLVEPIEKMGIKVIVTDAVMRDKAVSAALARITLDSLEQ